MQREKVSLSEIILSDQCGFDMHVSDFSHFTSFLQTLTHQSISLSLDVFISYSQFQNGGWPQFYGNNYPLRGSKITVYEGGTRAAAFVYGAGLKKQKTVFEG